LRRVPPSFLYRISLHCAPGYVFPAVGFPFPPFRRGGLSGRLPFSLPHFFSPPIVFDIACGRGLPLFGEMNDSLVFFSLLYDAPLLPSEAVRFDLHCSSSMSSIKLWQGFTPFLLPEQFFPPLFLVPLTLPAGGRFFLSPRYSRRPPSPPSVCKGSDPLADVTSPLFLCSLSTTIPIRQGGLTSPSLGLFHLK